MTDSQINISSLPTTITDEDSEYSYVLVANDINGNELDLTAESIPSWLQFDKKTGKLSGIPTNSDVGNYFISLKASNGNQSVTNNFILEVMNTNDFPYITSEPRLAIYVGNTYEYAVTAKDDDLGDQLTFEAISLPNWLTFDDVTGELSGSPTASDAGTSEVIVQVIDSMGAAINQNWSINVKKIPDSPERAVTDLENLDFKEYANIFLGYYPDIKFLDETNFLLASNGTIANDSRIYIQFGSLDDNTVSELQPVTMEALGSQSLPTVAVTSAGNFIVAFKADNDNSIRAKIFDSTGLEASNLLKVNSDYSHSRAYTNNPASDALKSGNFVVVWESNQQDGSGTGIFGQVLSSTGEFLGEEFQVNTETAYSQASPVVKTLDNGNFVVAWGHYGTKDSLGIKAQLFTPSGDKLGEEFLVNSYLGDKVSNPEIAALENGEFVIHWSNGNLSNSYREHYARYFDTNGQAIDEQFDLGIGGYIEGLDKSTFAIFERNYFKTGTAIATQVFDIAGNAVSEKEIILEFPDSQGINPSTYAGALSTANDVIVISSTDGLSGATFNINAKPSINVENNSILIQEDSQPWISEFEMSDADDDVLQLTISQPSKGIALHEEGSISYTPLPNKNGIDSFKITVTDGRSEVSQIINVSIAALNDPPQIRTTAALVTNEDTVLSNIKFSLSDVDNDTLTYTFGEPAKGSVLDNDDGTFTYIPDANANGIDTFTITVKDGTTAITETVNVTVNEVNDEPNGALLIVGDNVAKRTLYVDTSQIDDDDGVGQFSFNWYKDGEVILSEKERSYTLTERDIGTVISASVSYTDQQGTHETISANSTSVVLPGDSEISEIIKGTASSDTLYAGEGADLVSAGGGSDTIELWSSSAYHYGYYARNIETGSRVSMRYKTQYSSVIDGEADADTIILMDNSNGDAFFLHDAYSDLHESVSTTADDKGMQTAARVIRVETILAGDGDDIIDLTSDTFDMGGTNITLKGEAGDDVLWAAEGNDTLDGGIGDDTLFGGDGNDILTGGDGADVFEFVNSAAAQTDTITDYTSDDTLKFYLGDGDRKITEADYQNGILTWGNLTIAFEDRIGSVSDFDFNDITYNDVAF